MKTFKILTTATLLLFVIQTAFAAVMTPAQESAPSLTNLKGTGNLVKAIMYNGAYIPVVELPTIEIVRTKPGSQLLSSVLVKGEYMVAVNLPVVEIFAVQNPSKKFPAYIQNDEIIVISELPMIEIVSDFPYWHLTSATENETATMPVVNLPEIIISPVSTGNYIVSACTIDGVVTPTVNLPVCDISPAEFKVFFAANSNEFAFDNRESEWIYITLKNCGINFKNKIICEVTSKLRNSSIVIPEITGLSH